MESSVDSSVIVIKFRFTNEHKVLSDVLQLKTDLMTEKFDNPSEVLNFISLNPAALILISIESKDDLIQTATLLKLLKTIEKKSIIKTAIFNQSTDSQFNKIIPKFGIVDVFDTKVNPKALSLKIDFWVKSLVQQRKSQIIKTQNLVKRSNSLERNSDIPKSETGSTINWLSPVECDDDIWLMMEESHCKKILSRWMVKIMGPGPYAAVWTEVKGERNHWKFEIKSELQKSLNPLGGSWFFKGENKPEFNWKENLWMITGIGFELFYIRAEKKCQRVHLNNDVLNLTSNSNKALSKEKLIRESFDREIIVKHGISINNLTDAPTSGDDINYGNLQGKTDGTDNIPGQYKGRLGPSENNLEQKELNIEAQDLVEGLINSQLKTDNLSSEMLIQKNKAHQIQGSSLSKKKADPTLEDSTKENNNSINHTEIEAQNKKQDTKEGGNNLYWKQPASKMPSSDNLAIDQKSGDSILSNGQLEQKTEVDKGKNYWANKNEYQEMQARELSLNQAKRDSEGQNLDKQFRNKAAGDGAPIEQKVEKTPDLTPSGIGNTDRIDKYLSSKGAQKQEVDEEDVDLDKVIENMDISFLATQNGSNFECQLEDYFDQTLMFKTGQKGLNSEAPFIFDMNIDYQNKSQRLSVEANVVNLDEDEEGTYHVEAEIEAKYIPRIEKFMRVYLERQRNAQLFIKKAQGFI